MDLHKKKVTPDSGQCEPFIMKPALLSEIVRPFVDRREIFLDIAAKNETPLYVIDREGLKRKARQFKAAFETLTVGLFAPARRRLCLAAARHNLFASAAEQSLR